MKAKPWEVTICTWQLATGCWRWHIRRDEFPEIDVYNRYDSKVVSDKAALAAARRVMKRLNLVEKAKAGKE